METIKKQYGNISDYKNHERWLGEYNSSVGNLIYKNNEFSSLMSVETIEIDRRILNPEWLDVLKKNWDKGNKLYVLRQFQELFSLRTKYVANTKPIIL